MKIIIFFFSILKSRWNFTKPPQKKILIFDGFYNPFDTLFKKRDYNLFYSRLEEINIYILIQCLKKRSLNFQSYFENFVRASKPKVIITGIDNSLKFLTLSKFVKVPLISVQNGYRTEVGDLSTNIRFSKKLGCKFFVNEMFVYNKRTCEVYNSFIDGKKTIIGSYKNNINKIRKLKFSKKKGMLYVSCFKPKKLGINLDNISYEDFYEKDYLVIQRLNKLCNINKIEFAILARQKTKFNLIKEFNYYRKTIGDNFIFIKNYKNRNYFKYLDLYKYVATVDSTLPIENLSRGGRSIFIFCRPLKKLINSRRYGFSEGLPKKGLYWSDTPEIKEIDRLFKNIVFKDQKFWAKCRKINKKFLMDYNFGNKIFKKQLSKYLDR
jgi:surface carbohydrate biosynthesis protein